MALLPYVIESLIDEPYFSNNRLFDQNFGLGLLNDDLRIRSPSILGLSTPFRSGYLRTLRHLQPEDSGVSSIKNTKEEFTVSLDVQQFKPEEIKVKVTDDYIIIEGKHEEREDEYGFISREFSRKYKLPSNVKREAITSTVSSDGLLSIVAPKKVNVTYFRMYFIIVLSKN
ncbi:hypothetical protein PGB90_002563 [Kerria lacca]